jgi:hypothetical protein
LELPFLRRATPAIGPLTGQDRALAAELRRDVEMLALDIGARGTFAPERYKLAELFLAAALSRAGYEVRKQTFESFGVRCSNLEATIAGSERPGRALVLGAHYDTVEGCPGANDNASGVAGVLAVARALAEFRPACSVRFVLFANEEPPHFNMDTMGSQIYARACRERGEDVRMVCLETIGCYSSAPGSQRWPAAALALLLPDRGDFVALVGIEQSRAFIERGAQAMMAQGAFPLFAAAAPASFNDVSLSDHRGFNECGYEAFMVTDTAPFRYAHYHEPTDTAERIDFDSMARVVRGVLGMVRVLACEDCA